jgi:hypothetical protein
MQHLATVTNRKPRSAITPEHALTEHLNNYAPCKAHTDASPMRDEVTRC